MKVLFLLLMSLPALGQSVIDLGNLEIEGEVRRPMINLFQNPMQMNDSYKLFAQNQVLKLEVDLSTLSTIETNNKAKSLDDFEKQAMSLR
ncbi:MAG: hypothetical protein K9K67_05125 [Bacteriovoracaceae bacterium]|nr:hypothetical protein [Bacteriovoracaceae bacterium]